MLSWARVAAESLFATVFPADCRLCSAPLTNVSRLPVCPDCLSGITPIPCATCSLCGEGLASTLASAPGTGDPLCGLCRRVKPPFARAAAFGSYDGVLRDLIHLLKYEHVRPAAAVLGDSLAAAIESLRPAFGRDPVVVVPVPLYRGRQRERSFNQAELIVRTALKKIASSGFLLETKALRRTRATESQTGLTRHQRRENLRGAFVVARPKAVAGREILLVDDVFTTGTTVSECARVLQRAGASKVWVATVARTLKVGTVASGLEVAAAMTAAA